MALCEQVAIDEPGTFDRGAAFRFDRRARERIAVGGRDAAAGAPAPQRGRRRRPDRALRLHPHDPPRLGKVVEHGDALEIHAPAAKLVALFKRSGNAPGYPANDLVPVSPRGAVARSASAMTCSETSAAALMVPDQVLDAIFEIETAFAVAYEQSRAGQIGDLPQAVDVGGKRIARAEARREAGVITNSTWSPVKQMPDRSSCNAMWPTV